MSKEHWDINIRLQYLLTGPVRDKREFPIVSYLYGLKMSKEERASAKADLHKLLLDCALGRKAPPPRIAVALAMLFDFDRVSLQFSHYRPDRRLAYAIAVASLYSGHGDWEAAVADVAKEYTVSRRTVAAAWSAKQEEARAWLKYRESFGRCEEEDGGEA